VNRIGQKSHVKAVNCPISEIENTFKMHWVFYDVTRLKLESITKRKQILCFENFK
jgi:hypothetical protein